MTEQPTKHNDQQPCEFEESWRTVFDALKGAVAKIGEETQDDFALVK